MSKLDQLEKTLDALPCDARTLQSLMKAKLEVGDLKTLASIWLGAWETAHIFTSDEEYLSPLRKIGRLLI